MVRSADTLLRVIINIFLLPLQLVMKVGAITRKRKKTFINELAQHIGPPRRGVKKGMGVERDYLAAAAAHHQEEFQEFTWGVEKIVEMSLLL